MVVVRHFVSYYESGPHRDKSDSTTVRKSAVELLMFSFPLITDKSRSVIFVADLCIWSVKQHLWF